MRVRSVAWVLVAMGVLSGTIPLGAGSPVMDQNWMQPGFRLSFLATGPAQGGEPWDVSDWNRLDAVVVAVTADEVTLRYSGAGLDGAAMAAEVTYARATRAAPGHHALVWINAADVAAGQAMLGHEIAFLLHSTPLAHTYSTGTAEYKFDATTGLLLSKADFSSGSTAVRVPGPRA